MKVALINDQLNAGGAEKVLVNIANLLHKKGIEVIVVLYLKPAALDNLIHPHVPVFYLERKGRFDLKAMSTLKKIVDNVDIIHVHSRYNLRYLKVVKRLRGLTKPKIVFHEHVPVLSVDFLTKKFLREVDAYTPVLKLMGDWANKDLGIPLSKISYLPNVVNAPAKPIVQQPVGKKILMVGNIWNFKNQLFAVKLLHSLPADFTLTMYGMVNNKDYYNEVLDLISSYGLADRIKLVHNINNVYSIIGDYNFAIHTSLQETGPLVLLEYMHAQLPFLTYNTGDVVATIEHEMPEIVMQTFEVDKWKSRIEEVMMNEDARALLRAKMKEVLEKNYTEESYFEKLLGIYNKVTNN